MSTNGNDPAYPLAFNPQKGDYWNEGLTKREDFAKAAMVGILSNWCSDTGYDRNWIAGESARLADALISALNEVQPS